MKIRFGRMGDLPFIIHADEETRVLEGRPDRVLNAEDISVIRSQIRKKEVLVAEEDAIIGFVSWKEIYKRAGIPGKIFWIELIYVKKGFRRRGIGARLYQEMQRIAKRKGYGSVYTDIYTHNRKSARIHKKLGFVPRITTFERRIILKS